MRLSTLFVLTVVFLFVTVKKTNAQDIGNKTITVNFNNESLKNALQKIQELSGYNFAYKDADIINLAPVTYSTSKAPVSEVLYNILAPRHLKYIRNKNNITIFPETQRAAVPQGRADSSLPSDISGIVVDSAGNPIPSVLVMVQGTAGHYQTTENGEFVLKNLPSDAILVFSCVGYKPYREKLSGENGSLKIVLSSVENKLQDVTVNTGFFTRNKNTFTGATATYTGDQLKSIGNQNLIQSLKTLDPSFIVVANNDQGSNPNQLAKVEVRGMSGVSTNTTTLNSVFQNDPNQPLFILNGMESSLQQITNLDINRVASITILKDAASTALYGDKAANGVIVVETKKPKAGQLNGSYTMDGSFQFTDLSSYHMMNAAQNLEFQKLAGMYSPVIPGMFYDYIIDSIYNERLAAVLSGQNNNWMRVPLRNAFVNGHNFNIQGGDDRFQYGVTLSYKSDPGVMKGSSLNTYAGTIDLSYRVKKINFTNQTYITGSNSYASPYGSFSTWVNTNPYFNIFDSTGHYNTNRYLNDISYVNGSTTFSDALLQRVSNPLYNTLLPSFNKTNDFGVQNNFQIIYDIFPFLRFQAGFQASTDRSVNKIYTDPRNTEFDNEGLTTAEKGSYQQAETITDMYQGRATLTFNKVINDAHIINANLSTQISSTNQNYTSFGAIGFPPVNNFSLANAYGYSTSLTDKPAYESNGQREIQNSFSVNYSYKQRYLADVVYNLDGTSNFGIQKLFKTFTSFGLGWNINEEHFMSDVKDVDLLRIRADYGSTGNQNLGAYPSTSIYGITPGSDQYGLEYFLSAIGTPNLKWQVTHQLSLGLDVAAFDNRLTANINAYQKITNPLTINLTLPPSSGFTTYPFNVGKLNTRGAEATISFSPIHNLQKQIIWTLTVNGSVLGSKYEDIGNKLEYQNNLAVTGLTQNASDINTVGNVSEQDLIRYKDGYSPDELWAVRSLGIDPVTGQEAFLNRFGKVTYIYDVADEMPMGSTDPVAQGVVGTSLQIKDFTVSANFRYSFGASMLNTALYDKVENISDAELVNNQDVRALLDRWKQPGDIAPFADISEGASLTPLSSRFIQKENYFSGESFSVGYRMTNDKYKFLHSMGLTSLLFNAYMNDIFRISNIETERGISYPYAKSVSFSISAAF